MQVIHTAEDPPNQGRMSFEAKGCTKKSRQALVRIVTPKSSGSTAGASQELEDRACAAEVDTNSI